MNSMNKKEIAVDYFGRGYNCSQAVLATFCEALGMDKEMGLKIATGFGGGMRNAEVCGAVTGALMVLSLRYGHYIEGDTVSKEQNYAITKEFQERFKALNKTVQCRELLGYDLSKAEDMAVIKEKQLFKTVCPRMIEDAVQILEEMILEAI
jgi:C_GCAxxG_C_C family probable redox protein